MTLPRRTHGILLGVTLLATAVVLRAQQPAAPTTRSLPSPKPRGRSDAGPEPADGTDKKAPRGPKKAPDKGN